MKLEFLAAALDEAREAALFYEDRQQGLGERFRQEIAQVCSAIQRDPFLWRERRGGYHRVNCPVFPYYVAYIIEAEMIHVVAVAHGHRRPNYWKHRLD